MAWKFTFRCKSLCIQLQKNWLGPFFLIHRAQLFEGSFGEGWTGPSPKNLYCFARPGYHHTTWMSNQCILCQSRYFLHYNIQYLNIWLLISSRPVLAPEYTSKISRSSSTKEVNRYIIDLVDFGKGKVYQGKIMQDAEVWTEIPWEKVCTPINQTRRHKCRNILCQYQHLDVEHQTVYVYQSVQLFQDEFVLVTGVCIISHNVLVQVHTIGGIRPVDLSTWRVFGRSLRQAVFVAEVYGIRWLLVTWWALQTPQDC